MMRIDRNELIRRLGLGVALVALPLAAGCITELEPDTEEIPATVVIDPPDLHGHLVVDPPATVSLPDWQPTTPRTYRDGLAFDNDVYHVYYQGALQASLPLGEPFEGVEGTYTLVVNDTSTTTTIVRDQVQQIVASRIEVADVDGNFVLGSTSDWTSDSDTDDAAAAQDEWIFDESGVPFVPTGVGINLLAGNYTGKVTYQTHTRYFLVQVDGTELIEPGDLRGFIEVLAPLDVTMPDWAPVSAPTYRGLTYDNDVYHVFSDAEQIASLPLGEAFFAPQGTYHVILNDSWMTVTIAPQQTTTIYAGRLEVTDVGGHWVVGDSNDWDNDGDADDPDAAHDEWLMSSTGVPFIHTGRGINVLPGKYTIKVTYQDHTLYFPVDLPNEP